MFILILILDDFRRPFVIRDTQEYKEVPEKRIEEELLSH